MHFYKRKIIVIHLEIDHLRCRRFLVVQVAKKEPFDGSFAGGQEMNYGRSLQYHLENFDIPSTFSDWRAMHSIEERGESSSPSLRLSFASRFCAPHEERYPSLT